MQPEPYINPHDSLKYIQLKPRIFLGLGKDHSHSTKSDNQSQKQPKPKSDAVVQHPWRYRHVHTFCFPTTTDKSFPQFLPLLEKARTSQKATQKALLLALLVYNVLP